MFLCPHCKKTNTKKAGLRKNKSGLTQKYFCNACNKFFVKRGGFERMRFRPEIIVDALDLRAKEMSFGKIKDHILQKYCVTITRPAILYWQNKFGEMIVHLTKSFQLPISLNTHADEMFLRAKGAVGDDFIYYWGAIDYDTKFLIADHVSVERNDQEAKIFLIKVKLGIQTLPEKIHTDNSYDYLQSIKKIFGWRDVIHVHFPAWRRRFKNNPIERLHNTIRENYKVMRRFVNRDTARTYFIFLRNYYNFLRKHTTLSGRTPAEAAGFGTWNWWSLIKAFNLHKKITLTLF